jgi:peroxiredoxin
MANALTGEFDAVLEVSRSTLNRLLATLHQNGADEEASPSFPHSVRVRVGEEPLILATGWADAIFHGFGGGGQPAPPHSKAAPGASQAAQQAAAEHAAWVQQLATAVPVRGTAWVQLSTPTVHLVPGLVSELDVSVRVRAHYVADPGTAAMPEAINGELRARFHVAAGPWGEGGTTVLEAKATASDANIQFFPAPDWPLSELQAVVEQIRGVLRKRFEPTSTELEGFRFLGFKTLATSAVQAIALPVDLEGGASAAAPLASVTNLFLHAGDDIALAISKQYVNGLLGSLTNDLLGFHTTYTFSTYVHVPFVPWPVKASGEYKVSVSGVSVDWFSGKIRVTVTGNAIGKARLGEWVVVPDPLPDYSFSVSQDLIVKLDTVAQKIRVQAPGDPDVQGLPSQVEGAAKSAIGDYVEVALDKVNQSIDDLLDSLGLDDALHSFDGSAFATWTAREVQPQGVVLRGKVSTAWRPPVVVRFEKTAGGDSLSAFASWIPGGTVDRYVWSWQQQNGEVGLHLESSDASSHAEEVTPAPDIHIDSPLPAVPRRIDFLLKIPEDTPYDAIVCLRVEGTRVDPVHGGLQAVWGEACQALRPFRKILVPDAWTATLALPAWMTGPLPPPPGGEQETLARVLVAHVDAFARTAAPEEGGTNALVHFLEAESRQALARLQEGLRAVDRSHGAVTLILVLPPGATPEHRVAVEKQLAELAPELRRSVVLTEDYDSGWTRTFAVSKPSATLLINGRGEVVWQQPGVPGAKELAAALKEHLTPAARRAWALLPVVRPGERAPDVLLRDARGRRLALRKLRGRRVLLLFWKSWSEPCLRELDRLELLHRRARGELCIVAVNDGEEPERVQEARRARGLTYLLVADPERAIARRYGVSCWPTSVTIDARGRVEGVLQGARDQNASDTEDARTVAAGPPAIR